jgi:cytochrome b pre-mRNA-processing protein 3
MPLDLFKRFRSEPRTPTVAHTVYADLVGRARRPDWYVKGEVRDDIDGRFDMVVLMLALVLVRLEADEADERARRLSTDLVERFVADMDGSFREIGIGDMVISKHIGRSMQAFGGRLGVYRAALAPGADGAALTEALARNLYRGRQVDAAAFAWTEAEVRAEAARLAELPLSHFVGVPA